MILQYKVFVKCNVESPLNRAVLGLALENVYITAIFSGFASAGIWYAGEAI